MLRPGQGLVIFAVALLIIGVVMVNSAGLSVRETQSISLSGVLTSRPMIYALLAGAMLAAGACVPVKRVITARGLASPIPWLTLATLVLLLAVYLPGLSREMNGSKRWLNLGGVSFQPSEFAKWAIIILLAWHSAKRAAVMHRFSSGFVPGVFLIGLVCLLIGIHDLGTAVLVGMVGMAMLVAAGVRWWQAGLVVPAGAAAFTAAVIHSPYRINRLMAYVNPFDDPQGIGYHIIQSMSAVAGGGLAGRGLGNGVRKFGYLPEDTTDFIFAVICEELGIFGAALVLFLYGGLVVCGLLVARRVTDPFQRLLALGVVLTIGLQAAINIAVVTGVAPTKGIALPLLSHGGTGWALTAFSIGLLVSMDRRVRVAQSGIETDVSGITGSRPPETDAVDDESRLAAAT